MVEIEVDPATCEVTPINVTAVAEIGKAIHPLMAAGQIEGGTVQGIGYALIEEVVMRDGRMANAQLTNYIIPTPMDAVPMDVAMLERPYKHGPSGAKGVGEMPIDGPAPAVINALRHCGYDIRSIPATPERLMEGIRLRSLEHNASYGAMARRSSGAAKAARRQKAEGRMVVTINGKRRRLDVHPMKRLLDVLREDCGLTGTKEGCGEGECGACTVLLDGVAVDSCLVPVAHADGAEILTIEGVSATTRGRALQNAFVEHGGAQCGICTPGMIVAALPLQKGAPLDRIKEALAGNLCRCTGYQSIFRSVEEGLKKRGKRARAR